MKASPVIKAMACKVTKGSPEIRAAVTTIRKPDRSLIPGRRAETPAALPWMNRCSEAQPQTCRVAFPGCRFAGLFSPAVQNLICLQHILSVNNSSTDVAPEPLNPEP